MFQQVDEVRSAGRIREMPTSHGPEEAARLALARVRKVLTAYLPGMSFDIGRLQAALSPPLPRSSDETERLLALGFLHFLEDNLPAAEPLLHEAVLAAQRDSQLELLA